MADDNLLPPRRRFRTYRLIEGLGYGTVLALLLVGLPSAAWAQEDPARRDLIDRATEARDRGNHARALSLARDAAARRMSVSLRTLIAQEEAALGELTAALSDARTCVDELQHGAPATNPAAVMAECRALINGVSSRIGHVRLHVLDETVATVRVGGRELPRQYARSSCSRSGQIVQTANSSRRSPGAALAVAGRWTTYPPPSGPAGSSPSRTMTTGSLPSEASRKITSSDHAAPRNVRM